MPISVEIKQLIITLFANNHDFDNLCREMGTNDIFCGNFAEKTTGLIQYIEQNINDNNRLYEAVRELKPGFSGLIDNVFERTNSRIQPGENNKSKLEKKLDSCGIENLCYHRLKYAAKQLKKATGEIKMLGIICLRDFQTLGEQNLAKFFANGGIMKILIINPDSKILAEKARFEGRDNRYFRDHQNDLYRFLKEVQKTINEDQMIREILKEKNTGTVDLKSRLFIRQYDLIPYCNFTIIDNEKAVYNPYMATIKGYDLPVFVVNNDGPLFKNISIMFDTYWEHSEEYSLDLTEVIDP